MFPDKRCPACGVRITFRRFLSGRSPTTTCPSCGAAFRHWPFAGSLWAGLVGVAFIALPISRALCNPWWWVAVVPGMGLSLVWGYLIFDPRDAASQQGAGSR